MEQLLHRQVEALAAELLQKARMEPGGSVRLLAERLGHRVIERPNCKARVRGFSVRRPHEIYLIPSAYEPRNQFTIAHEIMELMLPLGLVESIPAALKEELCDRGAAALMLPPGRFAETMHKTGVHLPALRRLWRFASYKALAARMVDLVPGTTAASWDSGAMQWGRGPELGAEAITAAVTEALTSRGLGEAVIGGVRARAWRMASRRPFAIAISRAAAV